MSIQFTLSVTWPLFMVVTWNRSGALCGVIWHQRQLRLCHCRTCTAFCKAHPPLLQVVPFIVLLLACNSNHGLQQFNHISITISTPGPFGPGYRVLHHNELHALPLLQHGFSMGCSSFGGIPVLSYTYPQTSHFSSYWSSSMSSMAALNHGMTSFRP